MQVNGYLDPADFPGLQGKPWCPLVHGLEFLGCQKPTFLQVKTLSATLLLLSDFFCHALLFHLSQPKVVRQSLQLVKISLGCIVTTHRQASIFLSMLRLAQVLTLTSGLLPVDLGGCGTPANWEPEMWFYQYK